MMNLYTKNEINFDHNGLRTLKPLSAVISEEINSNYSLVITMPHGSLEINPEQIIKSTTPKNKQLFRIYSADVDMLGNPVYYCRHIFYDLLDDFIEDKRPTNCNGSVAISTVLQGTKFTGYSDISKQGTAYYEMISPVKAILGADNAFIKVWGGELERDNYNVKMLASCGANGGVTIRYRKNLTGLRLITDLSNVCTKIMPTGLQADGQTILKLPEKYVESPLINNYTNVKTQRIHYSDIKISNEMTEAQALSALRTAANNEFQKGIDKPLITATVEFIPLQKADEYKDFALLESVCIGDTVNVYHEPLGISMSAKVVSYEFDALSERYTKVVLGQAIPKFGDTQKRYIEGQIEETLFEINQAITETNAVNSQPYLLTTNLGSSQSINVSKQIEELETRVSILEEKFNDNKENNT